MSLRLMVRRVSDNAVIAGAARSRMRHRDPEHRDLETIGNVVCRAAVAVWFVL